MIEFKKKIVARGYDRSKMSLFAKRFKVGESEYDYYGKLWEVGEDINFDKFWFREAKK